MAIGGYHLKAISRPLADVCFCLIRCQCRGILFDLFAQSQNQLFDRFLPGLGISWRLPGLGKVQPWRGIYRLTLRIPPKVPGAWLPVEVHVSPVFLMP